MIWKHIILALSLAVSTAASAANSLVVDRMTSCDTTAMGVTVTEASMKRNGDFLTVSMLLDLRDLKMKGDRAILYMPVLEGESDTLNFNPIGFYGRTRWIQYQRNEKIPAGIERETAYKYSARPDSIFYTESVPFEPWMQHAALELRRADYGCCNHLIAADTVPLADWTHVEYYPTLRYARPVAAQAKRYELEGQSYIDFPVDQTVIYPEYRRNTIELDSIRRTIEIAVNNPDATIDTIWLKGFASPESPYKHNTELAIGRTAALKQYIQNFYNFDGVSIITDYEPEDWEGLRVAVEGSNLEHKAEILDIIDSDMAPDPKEWKIKTTYPAEYKFMLQNFYPPLRHTNYKVSYTVRSFSDPQEILQVMRTRPGNLSLNEFYIAASALTPGTPEYNEVFETAARMYPGDAVANLNAANAAILSGNYGAATYYLNHAGNSADAEYARAVLAAYNGDNDAARAALDRAVKAGLAISADELNLFNEAIQ